MEWFLRFMHKTPAELTVGEAGLMLLVCGACLMGIIILFLKASVPAPTVMRFPTGSGKEVNPFLARLDPEMAIELPSPKLDDE